MKSRPRKGRPPAVGKNENNFQHNSVRGQKNGNGDALVEMHHYEGAIPHPMILRQFNEIVIGSAERLVKLAEDESLHRREMQRKTLDANISAQQRDLDIRQTQAKAVFRSDLVGQIFGYTTCLACIGGAIYAAQIEQEALAIALTAMPTAALIKQFFTNKADKK